MTEEIKKFKTEQYYKDLLKSSQKGLVDLIKMQDNKITALEAQIEKMKCCINDLVHLGEFDEHTDEEYVNYQVHEALKMQNSLLRR